MSDAIAHQTRRERREQTSTDLPIGQKPDILVPAAGDIERTPDIVQAEADMRGDYLDLLKMAEDAVTILIHPSHETNAPIVVDAWVRIFRGASRSNGITAALPPTASAAPA